MSLNCLFPPNNSKKPKNIQLTTKQYKEKQTIGSTK